MYAFDEHGNVLIDATQEDLVSAASRNRTISRRAQALTQNQFIPFEPIVPATWTTFNLRLSSLFSSIYMKMKVPSRAASSPRGAGDFRIIFHKVIQDWASTDLQGFRGPIPAVEMQGLSDLVFFLPADGAVIRYLGRLQRKYPDFFILRIANGGIFTGRVATLDNTTAVMGPNRHGIAVRINERFGRTISGRVENNVNTLKALLQAITLDEIIEGVNKILLTLTRKLRSQDGSWGEDPKFPIVDFSRKVNFPDWRELEQFDRNFHGNNKELYADRAVYSVIADGDKLPFVETSGSSGEYKWTQPRS